MTDSTNPRVMADNIRDLNARSLGTIAQVEALQTYSSDETDTGKVWIDGRKIYRRILTGTTPNDNTATTVINTSGMNIVEIVTFMASVFSEGSGVFRTVPGSTAWYIFGANPGVRIYATSASYQNLPLTVVIEYMKEAAPAGLLAPNPDDNNRNIETPKEPGEEIKQEEK